MVPANHGLRIRPQLLTHWVTSGGNPFDDPEHLFFLDIFYMYAYTMQRKVLLILSIHLNLGSYSYRAIIQAEIQSMGLKVWS